MRAVSSIDVIPFAASPALDRDTILIRVRPGWITKGHLRKIRAILSEFPGTARVVVQLNDDGPVLELTEQVALGSWQTIRTQLRGVCV